MAFNVMAWIQRSRTWLRENDFRIFQISTVLFAFSMLLLSRSYATLKTSIVVNVVAPSEEIANWKMGLLLGPSFLCGVLIAYFLIINKWRNQHKAACCALLVCVLAHTFGLNLPIHPYPQKNVDQIGAALNATLSAPPSVLNITARDFWSRYPNIHQCCGVKSINDWERVSSHHYVKAFCCDGARNIFDTRNGKCYERGCLASVVNEYCRLNTPYIRYMMIHFMIMIVSMGWVTVNAHDSNHFTYAEWSTAHIN